MKSKLFYKCFVAMMVLWAIPMAAHSKTSTSLSALSSSDEDYTPSSSKSGYSVGTPQGTYNVSNGNANYELAIEVPDGGKLTPQISLSYSSSAGNGLAGYGFNINGISAITRGGKDLHHDKVQQGVKFNSEDNFYFQGKKLFIKTGTSCTDGAVFTPEGDPYTTISVHGSGTSQWFEVKGNDGVTYNYGENADSRLIVTKNSTSYAVAWYISRVIDNNSNMIVYNYATSNYCVRPTTITYGLNQAKSRGIYNRISFTYQQLTTNVHPFNFYGQKGKVDYLLKGITSYTNSQTYRQYEFSYNTSDGSGTKYNRLSKIIEKNSTGEKLAPVEILWNNLNAPTISSNKLPITYIDEVNNDENSFFSVDLNNDGISDVVRMLKEPIRTGGSLLSHSEIIGYRNYLFVSISKREANGAVSFSPPQTFYLQDDVSYDENLKTYINGNFVIDIDGDSYNDLIIGRYWNGGGSFVELYAISGKKLSSNKGGVNFLGNVSLKTAEMPLIVTFDYNGDGKDEFIYLEKKKNNNNYTAGIVSFIADNNFSTRTFNLSLPKEPKKLFYGDFNSDGLQDLIVLYDGGYTIINNRGGAASEDHFIDSVKTVGTTLSDKWRITQGDFNGDGLIDFAYPENSSLSWALNNGNGTFTIQTGLYNTGMTDKNTSKDNDKFTILAYDMDNDGKSDIFMMKADYEYHGGLRMSYSWKNNVTLWLQSTGNGFKLIKSGSTNRSDDAIQNCVFIGDFTGDGITQLANYGQALNGTDSNTDVIHYYTSQSCSIAGLGKVKSIRDGFENGIDITYKSAADPSVYANEHISKYPVNT